MAKDLKKRVERLEAQVEGLTRKVKALGRTAAKKTPRRAKVAVASATPKVKSAGVKRAAVKSAVIETAAPTSPSGSTPQSGAA